MLDPNVLPTVYIADLYRRRGLYHFIQAYNRSETTGPVKYLAAPENRDLGVVKRLRKKKPDPTNLETPQTLEAVKL